MKTGLLYFLVLLSIAGNIYLYVQLQTVKEFAVDGWEMGRGIKEFLIEEGNVDRSDINGYINKQDAESPDEEEEEGEEEG